MSRISRRFIAPVFIFSCCFLAVFAFLTTKDTELASSASLANFRPGNIVSDYVLSNYNSMTEAEIQSFLKSKNPCNDTNITKANNYPHLNYHIKDGHFVCLADELFGEGIAYGGTTGETAAHIIWQAAQDYQINPQALIVLLQKEQGLITDTWPNHRQYRAATGYGCPDTAPCNSEYYGFKNQVRKAAELFRTVLNGGWTNYPLGNNYIQYHPDPGCGGSTVNIENLATSALYRYTPYQPNAGALAAGYGTAACGAYGNRNFYLYFSDWFGDPSDRGWQPMLMPRIMTVQTETSKLNPVTKSLYDNQMATIGKNYFFTSKRDVVWKNKHHVCLRTNLDTEQGIDRCILMARMQEFTPEITEYSQPKLYRTKDKTNCKINLLTNEKNCTEAKIYPYSELTMVGEITINDITYVVSEGDLIKQDTPLYGIPKNNVLELNYLVEDITPTVLRVSNDTHKYLSGSEQIVQVVDKDTYEYIKFSAKAIIEGELYYRTSFDEKKQSSFYIPAKDLTDELFDDFLFPRNLKVINKSNLINLANNSDCITFPSGTIRRFTTKAYINNQAYFRTAEDSVANNDCAINSVNLAEI